MLRWNCRNDVILRVAFAIAASLGWALPAHAYEVVITDAGANVHWQAATVTLRIDRDLEAYFGDIPLALLLDHAATAWGGLEGAPELLVSRGPAETLGFHPDVVSNGIYLVENWTLWPNALAATVTTFQSSTGKLVDADVQVNANYDFAWLVPDEAAPDRYDLLSVLTHEMGHVLGLGDAHDAPGATMWPTVALGDTYQRDLDADDEAGVARIYGAVPVAEALGGAGCHGASVLWPIAAQPRNSCSLWLAALLLITLWVWSRRRGQRAAASTRALRRFPTRVLGRSTLVLGGALLFGGLLPPPAGLAPAPPLAIDPTAPAQWLPREDPVARQRLLKFVQGSYGVVKGRAVSSRAELRAGLIWTHFHLQGDFGPAELDVPGGSLAGLTQIVSGHALPRAGELLIVALQKHGPHAWAHYHEGLIYGGSLGTGPALMWE